MDNDYYSLKTMIELIDIESCFNVTHFPRIWERFTPNSSLVFDPLVFEEITYKCPDCKYMISFKDSDFKKHSHFHFSNLNIQDIADLDCYIINNNLKSDSFLDFYCPQCKIATRVLFSDGYGGRHGDYIVDIEYVIIKK
jgi:predicted RNA-binding Zn-ribbon protein involved in translation (DUF1610 family)